MSMPDGPFVSVPPLPIAMGSEAPALTLMPSQLGVPEFKDRPAPSEPVSQTATSPEAGATNPAQLDPAVKSVPVPALLMLAAKAEGVNTSATRMHSIDWHVRF